MTLARRVPMALVVLRLCLAPIMLLLAAWRPVPAAFGVCLVLAIFSDYFDGALARKLGIVTPRLRRLDSVTDTLFYICTAAAIWMTAPSLLTSHWLALSVLLLLEVARYAYDLRKFGKEAAYHMWSSKAWGLLLFFAAFCALVLHAAAWTLGLAIYWGIFADIEGLAISVALTEWRADVPTLWHARHFWSGRSVSI